MRKFAILLYIVGLLMVARIAWQNGKVYRADSHAIPTLTTTNTPFAPSSATETPVVISPTSSATATPTTGGIYAVIVEDTDMVLPGEIVYQSQVAQPENTPPVMGEAVVFVEVISSPEVMQTNYTSTSTPEDLSAVQPTSTNQAIQTVPTVPTIPTEIPCSENITAGDVLRNGLDWLYATAVANDGRVCAFRWTPDPHYCPANLEKPYATWRDAFEATSLLSDDGGTSGIWVTGEAVNKISTKFGVESGIPDNAFIKIQEDEIWGLKFNINAHMCSDDVGRPILKNSGIKYIIEVMQQHIVSE